MGWRNWSYIESDPTTAKIESQGTVMKSSGLLPYGYQYINLDDLLPVQLQRREVNANGPWKVDPSTFPYDGSTPAWRPRATTSTPRARRSACM